MINKANEINQMIKESAVYKRYLECKKLVEEDENLNYLLDKMKEIKDDNCRNKNDDLIEEYYELENEYYNSVIVKEYQRSKEELTSLLNDIADILYVK